jgi:glycosyltransferase involved in cell wall biosynthesis
MLRTLLFCRTFSKNHFAHALARYSDFPRIDNPYMLYACYRLGMYQTVATTPFYTGKNWRGGFARAVSLAACGRHEEAQKQIDAWLCHSVTEVQKAHLADCLAPFHPKLAHGILQKIAASVPLRAALCLRVGQDGSARDMLKSYLKSNGGDANPESYLYYSNAAPSETPPQKLSLLNSFLKRHQVPELALVDNVGPPGPMNVRLAEDFPARHGPLVSVLMTAYNSSERIAAAIHSVLNQTYRDLELIVVDDASSDRTGKIAEEIASRDSRVKFVRLPYNVGTYVAKNIGMRYATGEFVTCHDSDDWAHPVKIERQVAPLLSDKKLVFTTSHWVRMQDDGIYYARPVHPLMRLNPASPLFRRERILDHAGVWDPVRTGADSEFLARLKLVFGRKAMKRIAQPLTLGSHRPDSLMTAKETGYSAEGMSPIRLAYWEAWNHWHIGELRARRKPKLQSFAGGRSQFDAPENILVPQADIDDCLKKAFFSS